MKALQQIYGPWVYSYMHYSAASSLSEAKMIMNFIRRYAKLI
jgi:hypothetical protein